MTGQARMLSILMAACLIWKLLALHHTISENLRTLRKAMIGRGLVKLTCKSKTWSISPPLKMRKRMTSEVWKGLAWTWTGVALKTMMRQSPWQVAQSLVAMHRRTTSAGWNELARITTGRKTNAVKQPCNRWHPAPPRRITPTLMISVRLTMLTSKMTGKGTARMRLR